MDKRIVRSYELHGFTKEAGWLTLKRAPTRAAARPVGRCPAQYKRLRVIRVKTTTSTRVLSEWNPRP